MNMTMNSPRELQATAKRLEDKAERTHHRMLSNDLLTVARGYRKLAERRKHQNRGQESPSGSEFPQSL
jgi:hypothetical protein